MRIRGRRVAWLLASALPLLAEEHPQQQQEDNNRNIAGRAARSQHDLLSSKQQPPIAIDDDDENDFMPIQTATEAIHSDSFRLPSLDHHTTQKKSGATKQEEHSSSGLKTEEDHNPDVSSISSSGAEKEETSRLKTSLVTPQNDEDGNNNDALSPNDKDSNGSPPVLSSSTNQKMHGNRGDVPRNEEESKKNEANDDSLIIKAKGDGGTAASETKTAEKEDVDDSSTTTEVTDDSSSVEKKPISITDKNQGTLSETNRESQDGSESATNTTVMEREDPVGNINNNATGSTADEQQETRTSTNDDEEEEEEENIAKRVAVDYASKSAGALILEKAKTFKGTSNLLNSDIDRYAIAPCEDKKYVVIGLSEDILVKTIVLANYERFTSWTKDFQVLGSQTMGTWADLGTYQAKPGNGEQAFDLKEPAWARYLKIKFLTHHGAEYYCTISQIKVHGSTMLQGFHEQWEEENDKEDVTSDNISGDLEIGVENKTDTESVNSQSSISVDVTPTTSFLENFKESAILNQKLAGHGNETELFSTLYEMIPQTLNSIPVASSSRNNDDSDEPKAQIASMMGTAVLSLWRNSLLSTEFAKSMVANPSKEDTIQTPRMTDVIHEITRRGPKTKSVDNTTGGKNAAPTLNSEDTRIEKDSVSSRNETFIQQKQNSTVNETSLQSQDNPEEKAISTTSVETQSGKQETITENAASAVSGKTEILPPDDRRGIDLTILQLLERLPNSDCLLQLDFSSFKEKTISARKGASANGEKPHPASTMEPIFKKLTDEIKTLQTNLLVHDQFQKLSSSCYQRILLDLVVEMESLRTDHESRIAKLEQGFFARFLSAIVQLFTWTVVVVSFLVRVVTLLFTIASKASSIMSRVIISFWPNFKMAILSTSFGSQMHSQMEPVFAFLDRLHSETATFDFGQLAGKGDRKMWLPVLPLVLLIAMCRLLMLCRASNTTFRLSRSPKTLRPTRHKAPKSDSHEALRRQRSQSVPEERFAYENYKASNFVSPMQQQQQLVTVSENLPMAPDVSSGTNSGISKKATDVSGNDNDVTGQQHAGPASSSTNSEISKTDANVSSNSNDVATGQQPVEPTSPITNSEISIVATDVSSKDIDDVVDQQPGEPASPLSQKQPNGRQTFDAVEDRSQTPPLQDDPIPS